MSFGKRRRYMRSVIMTTGHGLVPGCHGRAVLRRTQAHKSGVATCHAG